ncbi:hypothetical protein BIY26_09540 [Brenneria goodwinii]|uniref:Uncharacterized protein n=1 Tax=Brenneria goodwinii TaxID=1109412 RepID=A0A250B901_9GAMM|nr:hypothetical protein [Brenneria goodwinii]ATA22629.1 hypothetical protein AWC36_00025 [Brenneria goodwinii]ATA23543.1 hypothetical protein AWC36_05165 [Brenneria goodwinii]ATA26818.1 hypothetical protein AWC36_23435 [Brenneria goodwinii]RLM25251.1 hypothetical protein BIY26_09540 [Brenneria goodwinii]
MPDVIDWPDALVPSSLGWRLESNSKSFRSPFNGATQTVRYPGSRWRCTLSLNNMPDDKSRRVEALVASLDGEYGRVKLWDYGRRGRTPAGSPLVAESGQTGTELNTYGWTPGTIVLKTGDYITVNDELKIIVADAVSDGNGFSVINIAPMLRSSPPADSPIEIQKPYGIFKLIDNDQGVMNRVPGVFTSTSIELEEAY